MIGKRLAHYEILALLGRGGMGEVYRARDTRLDRDVALKLLPPEFQRDPERLARFRREAKLLAALQHPHIAAIHGLEETAEHIFLAMELVEGEELATRLRRGPLPLEDALDIARQLSEGLEAAHERGIVHRDLKPANLKITPTGQLKILDFGLARAAFGDDAGSEDAANSPTITAALTQKGVILGTAAYMSPEQARGRAMDHRADIWSFGVVLFEMLSGKRLFEEETISDTLAAVLRAELDFSQLPGETPTGVRRLLERCLERDPRRRLRDIGEARVRLEQWKEDPASIHESHSTVDASVLRGKRSAMQYLPWGLFVLASVTAAFLAVRAPRRSDAQLPRVHFEIDVAGEESISWQRANLLLSPDGNWLAWLTPEGIHIRAIDDPAARLLEESENAQSACFSPDSRWVAFANRGLLNRIAVEGGRPFPICDLQTARGIAWVDPSTIVFTGTIASGLSVVALESGEVRALTSTDSTRGERSHRWPTTVPGQRAVLFECQFLGRDYDESDIRFVSLDGGAAHTLHRGGAAPVVTAAGQLLFVRGSTLYAKLSDLRDENQASLPIPVLENLATNVGDQEGSDGSAQYALDGYGNLLYIDDHGGGRPLTRLAWLDGETGAVQAFGQLTDNEDLRVSPDGEKVLIERYRDGEPNLIVHEIATGSEYQLTNRTGTEYFGAWSPDSRSIYWTQGADNGANFEIWRRLVDATKPAERLAAIPATGGGWVEDVSPDGNTLLVRNWSSGNSDDLFTLDLRESPSRLTPYVMGPASSESAVFLGDGQFVAYVDVGFSRSSSLLIRRFPDNGALWNFVTPAGGYNDLVWNTRAGGIFAESDEGTTFLPVAFQGDAVLIGQPRVLSAISRALSTLGIFGGTIHPDGKRAIVLLPELGNAPSAEPSMFYIQDWLSGVQQKLAAAQQR